MNKPFRCRANTARARMKMKVTVPTGLCVMPRSSYDHNHLFVSLVLAVAMIGTALWRFADQSSFGGSLSATHAYADDGRYVATLIVTDTGGLSVTDALTVTVNNVPPTVEPGANQLAVAGDPIGFAGSFTDPGVLDFHTILWDFGDGATTSATLTPSHAFATVDVYTVTLTVTDDDGGVGSDTLRVTVGEEGVGRTLFLPIIAK